MRYFEDCQVGDVFELGSRSVGEEEIIAFAKQYDPQPFHISPELAKDSFFGGIIASGWHTTAMFMRLLVDGLLSETLSLGSPGVDEIRWLKPVRPGDILRGRLTILECTPSRSRPEMGIIRSKGELFNQNDELVMHLISIHFAGRRPVTTPDSPSSKGV
ncbi:MAG: MaoC family dehydratase [Ktedonobacteraceae bacterium]|nr:MaoC family dehydratase [Ktedonobacteraceae bacterium]